MNKKIEIFLGIIGIFIVIALVLFVIVLGFWMKEYIYYVNYSDKIDSIMADDVEIERKWLIDVNKIPFDLSGVEVTEIEQTYICFEPEIRVRKLDNGKAYTFTVKSNMTMNGLIRDEIDYSINEEEYNNLVCKKEGNTIYKTRYQFLENGYLYAIDIFKGDLAGLAYLEIEFENKELAESFETPDWVIKDVTDDIRYKNGHLARYGIPE